MSKKTKKLERENDTLKRKHEATSASILGMAEEHERWKKMAEQAELRATKLTSIIQQMQSQGRRAPSPKMTTTTTTGADSGAVGSGGGGGGGSGSSRHDHGSSNSDITVGTTQNCEEVLADDDTLRDVVVGEQQQPPQQQAKPASFGPERPPPLPQQAVTAGSNGHRRM